MQYPPKTVRLFQKTRVDYLHKAKSSSLEVESSPTKAEVFMNGSLKGQTPLRIEHLSLGEHFLLVKREGYRSESKKIHLKSGDSTEKFSLKKNPQSSVGATGLRVKQLGDVNEQVRLGKALGHAMGVDKVVLVSVEPVRWDHQITARMIDLKYGASHKQKSAEVLDLSQDSGPAAEVLALELEAMADIDLAQNPKKYAESEVILVGKKRKKSFVKSPILWSLVGALVAGGAASALLLGGGGEGGNNTSTVTVSGTSSKVP